VAFERGSMREVISDAETGFLVGSVEEAVAVIGAAGTGGGAGTDGPLAALDRRACRRWVEEHFSVERMVDGYLAVYQRVLEQSRREDHRPWGYYKVLEDEPAHKTKRIVVLPGARLSLQRHRRRSEHWHVVSGRAVVTRDDEELPLGAGESVDIPMGAAHRMANPGTEPLTFIEVQRGDYFGEDDIERLEDDFGRS
ncbi:MAG TPA: cupin domain-containing protein, partial [Thermoleophilia bacterium]|nr:cupin domain-containing protein [Thermoleophilia bacterium]